MARGQAHNRLTANLVDFALYVASGMLIRVESESPYGKLLSTGCFEDPALGNNILQVISCDIRIVTSS